MLLTDLNHDVLIYISWHLPDTSVGRLRRVCQKFRTLFSSNIVWEHRVQLLLHMIDISILRTRAHLGYCQIYRTCYQLSDIWHQCENGLDDYIDAVGEMNEAVYESEGDLESLEETELCDENGVLTIQFVHALPPYRVTKKKRNLVSALLITVQPHVIPGHRRGGHWIDGTVNGLIMKVQNSPMLVPGYPLPLTQTEYEFTQVSNLVEWIRSLKRYGYFISPALCAGMLLDLQQWIASALTY